MGRCVPYIFVTIYCLLLRCNCSPQSTFGNTHKPYGPRMCRELCDDAEYSYLYLVEELSCHQIKVTINRNRHQCPEDLPSCTIINKSTDITTSDVVKTGWDICDKEPQGKDETVSASVQEKRDILLHKACEGGELAVVKFILSHGIADIECRSKNGRTAVMTAAYHGHLTVFDFLVSQGSDLSTIAYSNNLLHLACLGGNADIVKKLIDSKKYNAESRGSDQHTPLMKAAIAGHVEVFVYLVGKGCNMMAVDEKRYNVLHLACTGGTLNIVKYILTNNLISIESTGWLHQTPVMKAADHGHLEVFEYLIIHGCNLRVVGGGGNNMLHSGCSGGNINIVKYILNQSISDIDSIGAYDQTPIMMAAKFGHAEVVKFLVDKGCDLTVVARRNNNILHVACRNGQIDVVKYLLKQKVVKGMVNIKNAKHKTPVMLAKRYNHKRLVALLHAELQI